MNKPISIEISNVTVDKDGNTIVRTAVVNKLAEAIMTALKPVAIENKATTIEVAHAYMLSMFNDGAQSFRGFIEDQAFDMLARIHDSVPSHDHDPSCPHHPANADPSNHN